MRDARPPEDQVTVVWLRAGRESLSFEDCAAIWSNPDEVEDSGVDGGGGGAKVMDGEMGHGQNEGQVKRRRRGIADGNDCFGI